MRYAQIDDCEVVNGIGCGISIYVQGCPFGCPGCFNSEAWDFNGGKELTKEIEDEFLKLINRPYIKRVTILGGEPLADENVEDVFRFIKKIHTTFPGKQIWLYTGYTVKNSSHGVIDVDDDYKVKQQNYLYCEPRGANARKNIYRSGVLNLIDIVVDGRFEEDKKDLTLQFRGSSNQRIIDAKKSLEKGEVVLWTP